MRLKVVQTKDGEKYVCEQCGCVHEKDYDIYEVIGVECCSACMDIVFEMAIEENLHSQLW